MGKKVDLSRLLAEVVNFEEVQDVVANGGGAFLKVIGIVVLAVLLICAPLLLRALGNRGLIAVERLMGRILVMISVQMFFEGVQSFLHLRAGAWRRAKRCIVINITRRVAP